MNIWILSGIAVAWFVGTTIRTLLAARDWGEYL